MQDENGDTNIGEQAVVPPAVPADMSAVGTESTPDAGGSALIDPVPEMGQEIAAESAPLDATASPAASAPDTATAAHTVIVEKIVEKPVEIIKEVIREVPIERIIEVERIVEKPAETIIERIVEKPVEVIKEMRVYDAQKAAEETKKNLAGSRGKALAARQHKRDRKLERIIAFVQERGRATNDEVQVLIGATDRTARRYLSLLVQQGKLKKIGEEGSGVAYSL